MIRTAKSDRTSVPLPGQPAAEQATNEPGNAKTEIRATTIGNAFKHRLNRLRIQSANREFQAQDKPPRQILARLAFEGAGGACGEFDGVFGAGFFGVLFEG